MKKTRGSGKSMKAQSTPAVLASISFPPALYETLEDIAKQKRCRWPSRAGRRREVHRERGKTGQRGHVGVAVGAKVEELRTRHLCAWRFSYG